MAETSSLNCLFCRIPYQCLHSLNAWNPFSEKALLFTDFCFVASPFPKLRSNQAFNTELMNQLQKLYSKWLLVQMTPTIDPLISEHQAGFRRSRQASEILHVVSKLIELSLEWQQPLTIVRIDMQKAFDRIKQSAILQALAETPLHPQIGPKGPRRTKNTTRSKFTTRSIFSTAG